LIWVNGSRLAGGFAAPNLCAFRRQAARRRDFLALVEARVVLVAALLAPARLDFRGDRRRDFCVARLVLDAARLAFRAVRFGLAGALSLTASMAIISDCGFGTFGKPSSAGLVSKAALSLGP
jgi:hypothetical protein